MARHTRGRVAPRRHARRAARAAARATRRRSAVLLDVDGVLAPIVRAARRRAHARDDAPAADRDRPRLPHRRVRLRPPRLRRAPDRLARLDRVPGQPRLRDPAPRCDRAGGRPRAAGLDAARAGLHARSVLRGPAPAPRPLRGQGGDRRAALARRAGRGRRREGHPRRRRARRGAGLHDPLGPQGARDPPARADRQGRGHRLAAARRRPRRGDLRRRRPHRPRRVPRPRGARRHGPRCRPRSASACAPTRGRPSSSARPTRWSRARTACGSSSSRSSPAEARVRFVDFLKATVLLCAGAATLLAALTVVGGARTGEQVNTLVAVCWWGIAAVIGARIGRRHATSPPIARLLADAKMQTALPEPRPGLTLINRLWPLLVVDGRRGRALVLRPAGRRRRGGLRDHLGAGLAAPGRGGDRDRGARRLPLLRRPHRASSRRSG